MSRPCEGNIRTLLSCGREGFVTTVRVVDELGNDVPLDRETPGEIIVVRRRICLVIINAMTLPPIPSKMADVDGRYRDHG